MRGMQCGVQEREGHSPQSLSVTDGGSRNQSTRCTPSDWHDSRKVSNTMEPGGAGPWTYQHRGNWSWCSSWPLEQGDCHIQCPWRVRHPFLSSLYCAHTSLIKWSLDCLSPLTSPRGYKPHDGKHSHRLTNTTTLRALPVVTHSSPRHRNFTAEEKEAQRGKVICPRSHRQLNARYFGSRAEALDHDLPCQLGVLPSPQSQHLAQCQPRETRCGYRKGRALQETEKGYFLQPGQWGREGGERRRGRGWGEELWRRMTEGLTGGKRGER